MHQPSFDPGITQQFQAPVSRIINPDGTFNVRRRGSTWRDFHPYLNLINMGWIAFLASLFTGYVVVNTIFAALYYAIGTQHLHGAEAATASGRFINAFFFSAQTLSTVGYGGIVPHGMAANILASLEAMTGVLGFAVATGLLFGRVSRPSARVGFSNAMLINSYQDITSLQFRLVNRRKNSLMELEARVMLMTVDPADGGFRRNYRMLKLEREKVLFFPLTWTVVHPIDVESPLFGQSADDLRRLQAEVLILIKGYDDTFSQTVLARRSYRHDEIVWGKRFAPAFEVDAQGDLVLDVWKVGDIAP
jgi:inward rectifier potassium channel